MSAAVRCVFLTLLAATLASAAGGAPDTPTLPSANDIPDFSWAALGHALLCLVVAASLGAILAFRPRRAGGPPRVPHVIQTQVMLAVVGSLIMLVVGASLARAFGIAGAASLVRYRAKVNDPKDASVMLSCLAVGLASGVGLFFLAIAGTAVIVAVLWALEFNEAWPAKVFELKVSAKDPAALKPELEALLKRHRIAFELRGSTEKDLSYMAEVPQGKRTHRISEAISALAGDKSVDVEWAEKKVR
jgi:uncharacterized membrane protein YhiD involved in acid resistance